MIYLCPRCSSGELVVSGLNLRCTACNAEISRKGEVVLKDEWEPPGAHHEGERRTA